MIKWDIEIESLASQVTIFVIKLPGEVLATMRKTTLFLQSQSRFCRDHVLPRENACPGEETRAPSLRAVGLSAINLR